MVIHHEVMGDGPALLLLHAGVCDSRMWAGQRDELARDHTVITADLRGYGQTALEPGSEYSDAGDVLALLDHLNIRTTATVAASYGANVILQAASRAPERFDRLVLISPPVDGVEPTDDLRAFAAEEDRLLEAGDVEGATELNVRTWLGPDADEQARALVREMQELAFRIQLAAGDVQNEEYAVVPTAIVAPVRLMTGAHDLEFFRDCGKQLAAALPDVDHLELDWAGHLPTLERPEEALRLIRPS
jgi:3-oxoadipate enol-lactonase